jgi:hypothetical protein
MVSICDEGLPCSEKQMHRFLALHRMVDQKLATTPVATAYVHCAALLCSLPCAALPPAHSIRRAETC